MTTLRHINTTAIILKKRNIGEYDQFITLYSPLLGLIEARAKGARKITSSFIGHSEISNICAVQIYKTQHSYTLTQCQLIEYLPHIHEDLEQTLQTQLILNIFTKFAPTEAEQFPQAFQLLKETLQEHTSPKKKLLLVTFLIKLFTMNGDFPDVAHCNECQCRWDKGDQIYLIEAHLLCHACSIIRNSDQTIAIKPQPTINFNTMKLAHFIKKEAWPQIERLKLATNQQKALDVFISEILHYTTATSYQKDTHINLDLLAHQQLARQQHHEYA